ncbi:MAG: M12 family metallo-peptidase [Phycisphaerae bacterium]|nr:M12 family metallo-peptidase [Phycisphaerae bacterium]
MLASAGRVFSSVSVALVLAFAGTLPATAANSDDGLWRDVEEHRTANVQWGSALKSYRLVQLDQTLLMENFDKAPHESALRADQSPSVITLPMPDGTFQRFSYVESPVMAPELAAQFPEIKTYVGQGIDDPHATVRFDWTLAGFHALIRSPSGSVLVDPSARGQTTQYVSFYRRDIDPEAAAWTCLTDDNVQSVEGLMETQNEPLGASSGSQLRTYRIAIAATGEYTAYKGGVALTQASIATMVNRITGIYEQEFTIRLQLIANNNLLIYTNGATDPYSNGDLSTMIDENQANIDSVIGSANYDIGHVLGTQPDGASGVAGVSVVCSNSKALAGSACAPWDDESFTIQIIIHEMGHQLGSHHTWNGTGCAADQWGSATACEPGSGTTIMSYAGSCGVDDIQRWNDDYFHAISYEKIRAYCSTGTGGNCGTLTATGNTAPSLTVPGPYTIPRQTPFTLTATASDPNGDSLTYCWEDMDLGPRQALTDPDNGSSPLFRSWPPSTDPSRTFPRLSDLLNNTTPLGEQLPNTNRTLQMRCTVRDNRAGGGGITNADTILTVTTSAGPFTVTSPNTAVSWSGTQTVMWNVASTNVAPVSCSSVNIRLSIDGGNNWPYLLASNTPNDGSQSVTIPTVTSEQARIKVEAVGNVFFDISNVDFTLPCTTPGVATDVSASNGTYSYVYLTWTLPTGDPFGLSHCEIWRNSTNNSSAATRIEDHWTTTGYQDTSCSPGITYYYWIKMVNLCGGVSAFSASDSGWRVLAPPSTVTATDGTLQGVIRISWDHPPGATHYQLYRNTTNNSGTASPLGSRTTVQVYNDLAVTPGTTYYYWVKAATSSTGQNESDFSVGNAGWAGLVAPTVTASDGTSTSQVDVQWTDPEGANYFCVYRALNDDVSNAAALTGWITSTSFGDTTATVGRTYYYWVRAAAMAGGVHQSDYSASDSGYRAFTPPANVAATDGAVSDGISVSWDAVSLATHYRVYRSTTNDPATAAALGSWQTGTSFNDFPSYGIDYYYWVKAAAGSAGENASGFSAGDVGWRALPPPTNCVASDGDYTGYARITWELSDGGSWYRVYRGTSVNPKLSEGIGNWSQNATSYNDTSATPGALYYYWVRVALDSAGTRASLTSNMNSGWRALVPPTATASFRTYVDRVAVNWSSVTGATHYCVYRNTTDNPATATTLSGWVTTPPYNDTTAVPGTGYFYWVRAAVNEAGDRPSDFGSARKGVRALDCNNNGVPDQDDPDGDGDGVPDDCDNCPNTIPGVSVDANGCPALFVLDFDRDGDVDLTDFDAFTACATGPGVAQVNPGCSWSDLDLDSDVDQTDFAAFQRCFSGENRPRNTACLN